jgi:hypothetical protein
VGEGLDTVTTAVPLTVGDDTLVATTWYVPAVAGAVYAPEAEMLPPAAPSWTDQVHAVLLVPETAQVKVHDPPTTRLARLGLTDTVTTTAAVTVTVAVADRVGSALLDATT